MKLTILKTENFNSHNPVKVYELMRGSEVIGSLQTWGTVWEVLDATFNLVSKHTTIKAAVRVAARAL